MRMHSLLLYSHAQKKNICHISALFAKRPKTHFVQHVYQWTTEWLLISKKKGPRVRPFLLIILQIVHLFYFQLGTMHFFFHANGPQIGSMEFQQQGKWFLCTPHNEVQCSSVCKKEKYFHNGAVHIAKEIS